MAKDKKSFLVYCDLIHTIEHLSLEERGKVFTWLLEYTNDMNPEPLPGLLSAVVEPIKQQLKRDLDKYENICNRNRINGLKGGRPKNPKKPTGLSGNPKKPKKPDTDTDTDTVIDKDKDIFNVYTIINPDKKDLLERWLSYRKELGKPVVVQSTLTSLAKRFNKESYAKVEFTVNSSIDNQYQGLFWDRFKNNTTSSVGKMDMRNF